MEAGVALMRRVQHRLVADSLDNAPAFEATRQKKIDQNNSH